MFVITVLLCLIFAGDLFPAEDSVRNRIIYLIHGDGDYRYHHKGASLESDEVVLQQALKNAAQGIFSEYFIFHLKPKRSFLIFLPGKESEFYHFRNGRLITRKEYFRFEPVDGHSAESHLLREAEPDPAAEKNILLYYGHEIPLEEEQGYNASFPEVLFGLKSFEDKITELLTSINRQRLDLIVISSCNNGSPEFIFGLAKTADYIIASPGDLHLSQMNSASLQILENEKNVSMNAFALRFASDAYETLRITALTEIAISVYNSKDLLNNYDEKKICSETPQMNDIVRVFFRPSKFGKYKNRLSHSGWYCRGQEEITQSFKQSQKP